MRADRTGGATIAAVATGAQLAAIGIIRLIFIWPIKNE